VLSEEVAVEPSHRLARIVTLLMRCRSDFHSPVQLRIGSNGSQPFASRIGERMVHACPQTEDVEESDRFPMTDRDRQTTFANRSAGLASRCIRSSPRSHSPQSTVGPLASHLRSPGRVPKSAKRSGKWVVHAHVRCRSRSCCIQRAENSLLLLLPRSRTATGGDFLGHAQFFGFWKNEVL